MKIAVKYGKASMSFALPEKRLIEIASPKPLPAIKQIKAAFERSMKSPLGPGLADVVGKGSRVLLLTVDLTRPSPKRLLPYMTKALSALGARTDIMVALGNHRPMTREELIEHIGSADVLQSDPKGPMWELGTTSFGTPIRSPTTPTVSTATALPVLFGHQLMAAPSCSFS